MPDTSLPTPAVQAAQAFFDQLNHDYVAVHKRKEDLFWATYMATSDDHEGFGRAETDYKAFIADPDRLAATRAHLAAVDAAVDAAVEATTPATDAVKAMAHGLRGWLGVFEANIIDNDEGRRLMAELIEAERLLFARRKDFAPTHVNDRGETEAATLTMLSTNASTNPDESRRRSSYDGLAAVERWVLDNGFLEIVALRNRLARALGFSDCCGWTSLTPTRSCSASWTTSSRGPRPRSGARSMRWWRAMAPRRWSPGTCASTAPAT